MFKSQVFKTMRGHLTVRLLMVAFAAAGLVAMPLPGNSVDAQSCSPCQTASCRPVGNSAITPDIINSATATVRSSGTVDFTFNINPVHIMTINQPCSDPDGLQINGGTNVCGPSACTQVLQGFNTVTMSVTYCNVNNAMTPCFAIKYQSTGALGTIKPRRKTFQVLSFTPSAHTVDVPVDITSSLQAV